MTAPSGFHPVIMLPTYNNAPKLAAVLRSVRHLGWPMLVVDDGSTDATRSILDDFEAGQGEFDGEGAVSVRVVRHLQNRGKGAALRTGFGEAERMGFTHALTMDTDGQHAPTDAPKLMAAAEANPTALVTGCRNAQADDYPTASRVGRLMSNLCIFISSGRRVEDSQCGYRVYPLGLVRTVRCWSGRFGYEAEILTRSGWAGCPLVQVPVQTIYPPPGQRISHFRPVKDTIHGWTLHFLMSMRAVWPWPFVKWPENQPQTGRHRKALWQRVLKWFDPRELVRAVRRDQVSQMSVAAGLSVGVMIAALPVYPLQTVLAVYLSKRLHLHPVSTVLGSNVSIPPIGVAIVLASIYLGHVMLTGSPPSLADFEGLSSLSFGQIRHLMHEYFASWWIGGATIGWVAGWITFAVAMFALRLIPVESVTTVSEESLARQQGDAPSLSASEPNTAAPRSSEAWPDPAGEPDGQTMVTTAASGTPQ